MKGINTSYRCYTNHALDQFLKHLLEIGIHKIIRIGGRCAEPELDGRNLRVVSKEVAKTRVEGQILGQAYTEFQTYINAAGRSLKPLHQGRKGASWATLSNYLRSNSPSVYQQFDPADQDSEKWQAVGRDPLSAWLGTRRPSPDNNETTADNRQPDSLGTLQRRAELNIEALTSEERWTLADHWLQDLRETQSGRLFECLEEAEQRQAAINGVHDDVNRRALIQADVIGLTTTALAKHIGLLRRVRSKVVICEEAGEVMEPHVLSALMPGVEHLIQIGDHRQLRPQISNYSLSVESSSGTSYQLDRSQFERRAMGEPGMAPSPVAQLNVQRRMRPEISSFIRTVYPKLQDHESVKDAPDVVGLRHNVFWLDHDHQEDSANDGVRLRSHSNEWEVDMASGLVRHLVRQGKYASTDIALLTPYTGQLRKLRRALSKDFEIFLSDRDQDTLAAEGFVDDNANERQGIAKKDSQDTLTTVEKSHMSRSLVKKSLVETLRLATVDNFQGEEAKVIIVSLVRSNSARKVGFLRTENRINVLLSRAQHGMYLIGSCKTYLHVPMWADVHGQLALKDAVGTALPLCCPRHPQQDILCSEPEDFVRKSPEGGCNLLCERRLQSCGHRCQAPCHSDMMHEAVDCPQPCERLRESCTHPCPKLCGQNCGRCLVNIGSVELRCGHSKQNILCHQTITIEDIKCLTILSKVVPGCGHSVQTECHRDVASESYRCSNRCQELLLCGHPCPGTCGSCRKEGNNGQTLFEHLKCVKVCDRPYGVCNHRCPKRCHTDQPCGSCSKPCEVRKMTPFY